MWCGCRTRERERERSKRFFLSLVASAHATKIKLGTIFLCGSAVRLPARAGCYLCTLAGRSFSPHASSLRSCHHLLSARFVQLPSTCFVRSFLFSPVAWSFSFFLSSRERVVPSVFRYSGVFRCHAAAIPVESKTFVDSSYFTSLNTFFRKKANPHSCLRQAKSRAGSAALDANRIV